MALAPLEFRRASLPAMGPLSPASLRPEETARSLRFAIVALPLVLAATMLPWLLFWAGSISIGLAIALVVPISLVEFLVVVHIARRAQASRVARRMTASGRCGSCAHELAGLRAEADGCRVCPECGAAWR